MQFDPESEKITIDITDAAVLADGLATLHTTVNEGKPSEHEAWDTHDQVAIPFEPLIHHEDRVDESGDHVDSRGDPDVTVDRVVRLENYLRQWGDKDPRNYKTGEDGKGAVSGIEITTNEGLTLAILAHTGLSRVISDPDNPRQQRRAARNTRRVLDREVRKAFPDGLPKATDKKVAA